MPDVFSASVGQLSALALAYAMSSETDRSAIQSLALTATVCILTPLILRRGQCPK
jgi:hypothetical protein